MPPNNLSLSAYWPMNEGTGIVANDYSGNGNTGSLVGTPSWIAGKLANAVSLNGTTQYITQAGAFNFTSGPFTISYWIKLNSYTTDSAGQGPAPIYKGEFNTNGYYSQINTSGGFSFRTNQSGAGQSSSCAAVGTIPLGVWTHIAIARNGSSIRLYANGVDCTSVVGTHINPASSSNAFNLGYYGGVSTQIHTNGSFDDFRVYGRTLSAAEIKNVYQSGLTTINVSHNAQVTNGLVDLWSFDGPDISSTTAFDRSTGGNNGTLVNSPVTTIGSLGQALSFDGVSQYVNTGSVTTGNGAAAMSVCMWMKYNPSSVTTDGAMVAKWSGGGWAMWTDATAIVGGNTSTITFAVDTQSTPSSGGRVEGPTGLLTGVQGQWHHYCGTFQGGSFIRLYKDGGKVAENTTSIVATVVNPNTNTLYFANSADASAIKYLNGSLDDVRIYNRALSQNEITQLYNMGAGTHVNTSQNNIPGSTLQSGLVGLWSFNGSDMSGATAYDRSISGNNGTLQNSPTPIIGKVGQALSFNGTNQSILVKNSYLVASTSAISISAWINTSTSTATIYSENYTTLGEISHIFYVSAGKLIYDTYPPSAGALTGNISVNDGKWHHVAMTRLVNDTTTIYVDGVQDVTGSVLDYNGGNIINAVYIGQRNNALNATQNYFFNGSIDEVRVYNRALTASEVLQLYRLGQ